MHERLNKSKVETLKNGIQKRLTFVANEKNITLNKDLGLIQNITFLIENCKITNIDCYLILTGQYPSYSEIKEINLEFQLVEINRSIMKILFEIAGNSFRSGICEKTVLVKPSNDKLVDVTHTHNYPYVTGIQRVVRKTVGEQNMLSLLVFDPNRRHFTEISHELFRAHLSNANKGGEVGSQFKQSNSQRLLTALYKTIPIFDKSSLGIVMKRILLPFARIVKFKINSIISKESLRNEAGTDGEIMNLYILNSHFTLLDIPPNDGTLDVYQGLFEHGALETQLVLYDFIPIFHTWAVDRLGVAGHFNKYLRLVLFADRIVAISKLVEEQAKLVSSAFKLERTHWLSKAQIIESMNLPSGLTVGENPSRHERHLRKIIVLGSVEPRKNHMQILYALEFLHKKNIPTHTVIVGHAGWENEPIVRKINELKSSGLDIERLSNVDDASLIDYLTNSCLNIFVSEAEGYGLPVIEGLQSGTQTIISDIRPLKDIYSGPGIVSVDLGNVQDLAIAIDKLLSNCERINLTKEFETITWNDWSTFIFNQVS